MRRYLWMPLVLALMLSIPSALRSQVAITGSIVGTITDPSGAVVPGADVTLRNEQTGLTLTTKSNDVGFYSFTNLVPGKYNVKAEKSGFAVTEVAGVTLLTAQQQRVDIGAKVGATTQTVQVTVAPTTIETDRTLITTSLSTRQITELPVNRNRDRIGALMMLMPGVQFPFGDEPRLAGTNVYGGVHETVDGGTLISGEIGFPGPGNPNFEAIQELQVVTNSPSAEYSYGSTHVVIVSKSGTNAFHGDLFWFNCNRSFRAREKYEGNYKAPSNRNEWGGDFGGPIKKDKLFIFGSLEDQIIHSTNFHAWSMPTVAIKGGDFSGFLPGKVITDPTTGLPFAGNIIPPGRITSVAKSIMAFMPDPNQVGPGPGGTGSNLTGSVVEKKNYPRPNFRIDYQPSSKDRIFGRYEWNRKNGLSRMAADKLVRKWEITRTSTMSGSCLQGGRGSFLPT